MTSPDSSRSGGGVWAAAVAVALGVVAFVALTTGPGVDFGSHQVADTDGYMRLTRITELRTGEVGWFDSFEPRANAPFGHSMHWTRPLDAIVVGLSLPLDVAMSTSSALYAAAMAVGPLLLGLTAGAMVWAVWPLLGSRGAVVAGLGVAVQPTIAAYGGVSRVDHHVLLFASFALFLGLLVRVARDRSVRWAAWAGVAAAFGLWVSTEFLLPIALALAVLVAAWVREGEIGRRVGEAFSVGWVVATAVFLVVERGSGAFSSSALDRISTVHLVVAVGVAAFWVATRAVRGASAGRLVGGAVLGAAVVAVLFLLEPAFFSGPFGDVPAALWDAWLGGVAELQPLWPFGGSVGAFLYLMTAPLVGIALAVAAARRSDDWRRAMWAAVAAALVVLAPLAIRELRFTAYPELLALPAFGWMTERLLVRIGGGAGPGRVLGRVGAMALGVVGFFVPALVAGAFAGTPASTPGPTEHCDVEVLAQIVREAGDSPVVVTHIDDGPRLLYETHAQVVATPYHRNVDGILDARAILLDDPVDSARLIRERDVSFVAVCPQRDAAYLGADDISAGSLFTALTSGTPPDWLRLVSSGDLRVFEVVRDRLP